MSSNLRVNNILPSVGTNVAIGTAGGSITLTGTVSGSSNINVGTGASISSPATNVLTLGTNNVESVRIDSSGRLGIGTVPKTWTSGYNVLQVGSASLVGQSEQDGQTTNWSNNAYFDTNDNRWEYSFADQASQITQSDGLIIFKTASTGTANAALSWTESARFNTSGNLAFPSGQGIDFSATANSSGTMTSELLSDYERGTWTPSFVQPATSANIFINNGLAIFHADYVKIGNLVYISCYIQNDASFSYDTGRGGSDPIGVGGLPFIVSNTPTNSGYHPIYVGFYNSLNAWSAGYTPMGYFYVGTNNLGLTYASTNTIANVTAGTFSSANSSIMLSGWYRTDS